MFFLTGLRRRPVDFEVKHNLDRFGKNGEILIIGPRPTDPARPRELTAVMLNAASAAIQGMQVFLVEDEALVALMLEDMLADLGCVLVGTADTVARALSRITEAATIDAAILDVHLGGETVFPVADALLQRRVPFAFSTGFGPADLAARYPGSRLLAKPYPAEALAQALANMRPAAAAGQGLGSI